MTGSKVMRWPDVSPTTWGSVKLFGSGEYALETNPSIVLGFWTDVNEIRHQSENDPLQSTYRLCPDQSTHFKKPELGSDNPHQIDSFWRSCNPNKRRILNGVPFVLRPKK